MSTPVEPQTPAQPRYGWVTCASCGGTGTTRHYRGNSLTVNHLIRGGDPTRLPCGDCRGNGRSWGVIDEPRVR